MAISARPPTTVLIRSTGEGERTHRRKPCETFPEGQSPSASAMRSFLRTLLTAPQRQQESGADPRPFCPSSVLTEIHLCQYPAGKHGGGVGGWGAVVL